MTTTEATEIGLGEATRRIAALENARSEENRRHEKEAARLDRELAEARHRRDLVLAGARLDVVDLAEQVIEVFRPENVGVGDGRIVVGKAIRDLADGAPNLVHSYFGTKNYDRWTGQEEGGSYGSGPRHGSTIFSIGLRREFRRRFDPSAGGGIRPRGAWVDGEPLSPDQIDAAIAYLHALLGTLARP